jgi:hypothetical protein
MTSCAAATMVLPSSASILPSEMLVSAAARLTMPSARTMGCGCFSQPILKLPSERCAWAPQYFEASTSMGPKVSDSVRVFAMGCQAPSVSRRVMTRGIAWAARAFQFDGWTSQTLKSGCCCPRKPIDQNAVSSRQAVVKVSDSERQRGEALKSLPSVRSATSWKRPAAAWAKPW